MPVTQGLPIEIKICYITGKPFFGWGLMKTLKTILRIFTALSGICLVVFVTTKTLPAAFQTPITTTHVEIDGIDYGSFEEIEGLGQFDENGKPATLDKFYAKITLKRHFVTDPSLYLWAKNRRSKKTDLKNVELVTTSTDGTVVSRQTLEFCQPLSWTVEKANPSLGGFNETIDLAVQKLSIH